MQIKGMAPRVFPIWHRHFYNLLAGCSAMVHTTEQKIQGVHKQHLQKWSQLLLRPCVCVFWVMTLRSGAIIIFKRSIPCQCFLKTIIVLLFDVASMLLISVTQTLFSMKKSYMYKCVCGTKHSYFSTSLVLSSFLSLLLRPERWGSINTQCQYCVEDKRK